MDIREHTLLFASVGIVREATWAKYVLAIIVKVLVLSMPPQRSLEHNPEREAMPSWSRKRHTPGRPCKTQAISGTGNFAERHEGSTLELPFRVDS
jgi:hypothetical protein